MSPRTPAHSRPCNMACGWHSQPQRRSWPYERRVTHPVAVGALENTGRGSVRARRRTHHQGVTERDIVDTQFKQPTVHAPSTQPQQQKTARRLLRRFPTSPVPHVVFPTDGQMGQALEVQQ